MQRKEDRKQKETDEGVMKARALETPSMNPQADVCTGTSTSWYVFSSFLECKRKTEAEKKHMSREQKQALA